MQSTTTTATDTVTAFCLRGTEAMMTGRLLARAGSSLKRFSRLSVRSVLQQRAADSIAKPPTAHLSMTTANLRTTLTASPFHRLDTTVSPLCTVWDQCRLSSTQVESNDSSETKESKKPFDLLKDQFEEQLQARLKKKPTVTVMNAFKECDDFQTFEAKYRSKYENFFDALLQHVDRRLPNSIAGDSFSFLCVFINL